MTPQVQKKIVCSLKTCYLVLFQKENLKNSTQEKAPDRTAPTETSEPDIGSKRYHLKITVPQNDW